MSQHPSKLTRPQEEEDNRHTLSLSDLRSLSFSYMQRFEDESKTQAKPRLPFRDQSPEDDFEFCSTVSNTNVDILFCGKIIRQRESTEKHSSKTGLPATAMPMKFPYQRVTHVPRSASSKRTNQKLSYGVLAFHPEMDLSEMKKRQASLDQRESVALLRAAAAGTDDLESGITAGCDHHDKKKLGLIRRMRSKGNIISVLACYPLAAPVMKPN